MKNRLFAFVVFFLSIPIIAKAQSFDVKVVEGIQSCRSVGMDNSMLFFSNSVYVVAPAVPLSLLAVGLIKKDNEMLEACAQMASSILLAGGFSLGLKEIVKRERPYRAYPDLIDPISSEKGYSMPSAHTSFAFSTAASLSLQYPKWYIITPSFLWAGTVAYSRIYLGDHYLSDVFVGACIGVASAYATFKLEQWLKNKKRQPRAIEVKIL